jgi:protein SCO1/2/putative membrane protein
MSRPLTRLLLPALLAGATLLGGLSCRPTAAPDDLGTVGSFELTERNGQKVTDQTLRGKVWIASFLFTRCSPLPDGGPPPCPQVARTLEDLQKKLRLSRRDDIRLVTFTVDPDHDQPKELQVYARAFHADPDKWLFLTGSREQIYRLLREDFKVGVAAKQPPGETKRVEIDHSTRLVVVDQNGHIRGYFEGLPSRDQQGKEYLAEFEESQKRLRQTVAALTRGPIDFPLLNASLNAAAGVLLLLGFAAIRRRQIALHKACMLTALVVSATFLGCYLYYHLVIQKGQPTHFSDRAPEAPRWVGLTYLAILGSHTLLAALVAPLALYVTWQGLRGNLARHVRVARWTLPLWLYVSVTGVVVYWMLYRLYPSP